MTIGAWAQLALGLVQLLNWVATKVDQNDWKNEGFLRAMKAYLEIMNKQVQDMRDIAKKNSELSNEELDKGL